MEIVRTPFLDDDQVPEGFTPIRVEIAMLGLAGSSSRPCGWISPSRSRTRTSPY